MGWCLLRPDGFGTRTCITCIRTSTSLPLPSVRLPRRRLCAGLLRVRGQTLDAFGLGEDALQESSDIKQTDVDTLVGHLKKALKLDGNDDASKCFTPNSNQPFRRGSGTPWGDIRKEEQKKSTKDYVEEKLRGCPGNNMPSVQI